MKKIFLGFILLGFVMSGCGKASETASSEVKGNAAVAVLSVVKAQTNTKPSLRIHVKNTGKTIAYNLACSVNITINGTDIEILEGSVGVLTNPPDLGIGETTEIEAVFKTITEHQEYTGVAFDFSWREDYADSVKYQSFFSADEVE